jgi:hypothetical protein
MAKSTATCTSLLALLFNGTAFADIAENDSSGPLGTLYVSLHTDSPGTGGSQLTNEANYSSYARLGIVRTAGGWTVASGQAKNTALAQFIECDGGSNIITHVAIGTDSSGAGRVLYAGSLSAPRTISSGIQAQFNALALVVTES